MLNYGMCCQRVTVYRKTPQGILRQEVPNCFLQIVEHRDCETAGVRQQRSFLLIQPGSRQLIFAGDRILEGVGPEVTEAQWQTFLPGAVPGLVEAAYAAAYQWQGKFCHTEAGRK